MCNNSQSLSILQWNARGLYGPKLTEFKKNLRNSDPSIVLLSETHWIDPFPVSSHAYDLFCLNRATSSGGVAILAKKLLSPTPFPLPQFQFIEAVGI